MWFIVAFVALLPDALAYHRPPLVTTITPDAILFQRMKTSQLDVIPASEISSHGPRRTHTLRFPTKTDLGATQLRTVHSIYSASTSTLWVEWYAKSSSGSLISHSYPYTASVPVDLFISGKLRSDAKRFTTNSVDAPELARAYDERRPNFPISLVAVFDKSCERYEIIASRDKPTILSCSRITAGSPPTITHIGNIPCPFEDHFVALPVGESLYYVTASGKLFVSKRDKKGLPSEIESISVDKTARILGVLIDPRVGDSYVFTEKTYFRLEDKPFSKFSPTKPIGFPLHTKLVSPDMDSGVTDPTNSFDFALFMYRELVDGKAILPFKKNK